MSQTGGRDRHPPCRWLFFRHFLRLLSFSKARLIRSKTRRDLWVSANLKHMPERNLWKSLFTWQPYASSLIFPEDTKNQLTLEDTMVSYGTFTICMYFFREIAITCLQRGIYRGRLPVAERRPLLISRKKTQSANWLKIILTGCCHPVRGLLCLST